LTAAARTRPLSSDEPAVTTYGASTSCWSTIYVACLGFVAAHVGTMPPIV